MLFTQLSETIPSLISTLLEMFMVRVDSEAHGHCVLMGTGPVSRSWCELVVFFTKQAHLAYRTVFTLCLSPWGALVIVFFRELSNELQVQLCSDFCGTAVGLNDLVGCSCADPAVQEDGDGNRDCLEVPVVASGASLAPGVLLEVSVHTPWIHDASGFAGLLCRGNSPHVAVIVPPVP